MSSIWLSPAEWPRTPRNLPTSSINRGHIAHVRVRAAWKWLGEERKLKEEHSWSQVTSSPGTGGSSGCSWLKAGGRSSAYPAHLLDRPSCGGPFNQEKFRLFVSGQTCQDSHGQQSVFPGVQATRPQWTSDPKSWLVTTVPEAPRVFGAPLPHKGPLAPIGNSYRTDRGCIDTHFNCSDVGGKTHLRKNRQLCWLKVHYLDSGYLENT